MNGNQSTLMHALYEGGQVERYHTRVHLGSYTVASHSWGVAVFILAFCDHDPSPSLLRAALLHDVHERWTGDGPSPARREFPELQQGEDAGQRRFWRWTDQEDPSEVLTDQEKLWLRLGDCAEAFFWSKVQYSLGNQRIREFNERCAASIAQMIEDGRDHLVDPDGLRRAIMETHTGKPLPEGITDLETL
jgi:hypothetical protein